MLSQWASLIPKGRASMGSIVFFWGGGRKSSVYISSSNKKHKEQFLVAKIKHRIPAPKSKTRNSARTTYTIFVVVVVVFFLGGGEIQLRLYKKTWPSQRARLIRFRGGENSSLNPKNPFSKKSTCEKREFFRKLSTYNSSYKSTSAKTIQVHQLHSQSASRDLANIPSHTPCMRPCSAAPGPGSNQTVGLLGLCPAWQRGGTPRSMVEMDSSFLGSVTSTCARIGAWCGCVRSGSSWVSWAITRAPRVDLVTSDQGGHRENLGLRLLHGVLVHQQFHQIQLTAEVLLGVRCAHGVGVLVPGHHPKHPFLEISENYQFWRQNRALSKKFENSILDINCGSFQISKFIVQNWGFDISKGEFDSENLRIWFFCPN